MKKALVFLLAASLLASACSTLTSVTGTAQASQELTTVICPAMNAALQVVAPAQSQLSAKAQAAITKAQAGYSLLCNGAAAVALTNLQTVPGIISDLTTIVNATNLSANDKLDIDLTLGAASAAYSILAANLKPALPSSATPSPASTPAPSAAPASPTPATPAKT